MTDLHVGRQFNTSVWQNFGDHCRALKPDFLVVTDAQRALYTARDQLSDIRRARLTASVALFKAMGGGFTAAAL